MELQEKVIDEFADVNSYLSLKQCHLTQRSDNNQKALVGSRSEEEEENVNKGDILGRQAQGKSDKLEYR